MPAALTRRNGFRRFVVSCLSGVLETGSSAMTNRMWTAGWLGVACVLSLVRCGDVAAAAAEPKVKPGELVIDHPTLINLGFEWVIQGDDNRNAQVEVSYRRQGETQWKQGLPLLRLQGEQIYQGQGVFDVVSPNMFAGSILDLEPDTPYEARFVLSDPDGLLGHAGKAFTKTVTVRTRPEPKPYAGGKIYHVYHPDYKG